MGKGKNSTGKNRKKYQLEFSATTLFFWCLGLFFLLAWIFVLGIMAGRGLLPHGMESTSDHEKKPAGFQLTEREKSSKQGGLTKTEANKPEFTFYKELTSKKNAAIKKEKFDNHILVKNVKGKTPPKKLAEKRKNETGKRSGKKNGKVLEKKDKGFVTAASGNDYTVQVASLKTESDAIKMVKRLTGHGYDAYYLKSVINGKKYYRIRCGRFRDRASAEGLKSKLAQKEGMAGFVIRMGK